MILVPALLFPLQVFIDNRFELFVHRTAILFGDFLQSIAHFFTNTNREVNHTHIIHANAHRFKSNTLDHYTQMHVYCVHTVMEGADMTINLDYRIEQVERFLTRPDGFAFLERELERLGDWDRALYSVVIASTGLRRVDRIEAVAAQINARIDNSSATAAA